MRGTACIAAMLLALLPARADLIINELHGFNVTFFPPVVEFTASAQDTTNAGPWTFATQAIGVADQSRLVCVAAHIRSGTGTATEITGVTIGGSAAAEVANSPLGVRTATSIFCLALATGTTATVVVTGSSDGTMTSAAIGVWRLVGLQSHTAFDTDAISTSTALNTVTLDFPSMGVIIVADSQGSTGSMVYSGTIGLTATDEKYDVAPEGTSAYSAASGAFNNPITGGTVICTGTLGNHTTAVASWR